MDDDDSKFFTDEFKNEWLRTRLVDLGIFDWLDLKVGAGLWVAIVLSMQYTNRTIDWHLQVGLPLFFWTRYHTATDQPGSHNQSSLLTIARNQSAFAKWTRSVI